MNKEIEVFDEDTATVYRLVTEDKVVIIIAGEDTASFLLTDHSGVQAYVLPALPRIEEQ